jgi:epoxyqueuosine reductase
MPLLLPCTVVFLFRPNHSTLLSVIHGETRLSNAREKEGPSLRWNHTRWQGQDFIIELSKYLVSLLEGMGFSAIAPELSSFFEILLVPGGFASKWSQRHIAYAAGLGTFSLNEGFITPKGLAVRCGSVVTNLKLEPSTRPYTHHLANCLFYAMGKCCKCIRRCPGGAISEKGHDKLKCFDVLYEKQKPWLEGAHGQGYIGNYAGCGLCQTGVQLRILTADLIGSDQINKVGHLFPPFSTSSRRPRRTGC